MEKTAQSYAIAFLLSSFTSYVIPLAAQVATPVNNISDRFQVNFVQQPQLPDEGSPTGRRKGAAGRGNCTLDPPLTALVPAIEKTLADGQGKATYVWGKTIAAYPTFWFYVPYSPTSIRSIEFVLQDGEDDFYRAPIKLPQTPGIVSFRLPSTAKPLEVGKMYHWFFKVKVDCAPQQPSEVKDYVEGWVQRVVLNPSLTSQLEVATPQQRTALYAINGIWYEALTSLGDLRLIDTENGRLQNQWNDLLQAAGLNDIVSKPIVECCGLKTKNVVGSR